MNDDEFATRALEHWRAEEPPAGFADRVLAAREHAVSPRRIARWAVAAAIAGLAISAWSFARAHRASTGDQSFASRETVELGKRGRAVAEAGTHLAWSISAAGDARVSQPAGSVFYRIEPGGDFVVGTPAGDVTVTGTCFRVEVTPMASNVVDNKQRAFFALGWLLSMKAGCAFRPRAGRACTSCKRESTRSSLRDRSRRFLRLR
jgi:ferric-dicitrate binding protein FerR (iron transport regulator)